ncbi:TetR/AcrR family transcriptional regulator [Mycolicibacterium fluoranthenivorans]|jgi:AcrR family transcriptional regulator|uniref:TetR/AcrR family transcriptional regulator n=1 Tax=Mycolicibacterium fluoranthenivorans TaxID=258505 RepID=A0A1G4WIL3_9MYCO|nr:MULTISPECIES: TetR/AcrR family transcriptional regulator [Mycobacteriaceae]MCV7253184.1 TetR/AcrR family transcriptional regulator [Mycobacterium hackensackense]QNJ93639.1 TetR/AcrR family transcriptional regulator [Mycolicibacterium fluoranthenivorans]SCX23701.1 transcriptional regulator, TetR family [Mycolicibacterium fluoranthenivorans]
MGVGVSRDSYFEAGIDILSDLGYGGLKLAEVCQRLGVTTGSFYHYFTSWSSYTRALVDNWVQVKTTQIIDAARAESDPRRRIGTLVEEALALPHGAEAAIRVWSSIDPTVGEVQRTVDQQRFDIMKESALEILTSDRQAHVFAIAAVYLLTGYEQTSLPRDFGDLRWLADQLLDGLDSGMFGTVPDHP